MKAQVSIDELTTRIAGILPENTGILREDLRKNLRAVLTATLARMDLITREEFDVQSELLARTRARLEQLEQQLAELEKGSS